MLHIIYRSYGGENTKGRPNFYSKLLALASLVKSFQQLKEREAELIFLNDGPIPTDRLDIMKKYGEVLSRSQLGMRGSFQAALELPSVRVWPRDDLVWFAEDDYLYQPYAMPSLIVAADVFPHASYFGLYALVGSRLPNGAAFDDVARVPKGWTGSEPKLVLGRSWSTALSTTSTFGARVSAIVVDQAMMVLAIKSGGAWDHTICLMYQGHFPYPMASLINSFQSDEKITRSRSYRIARLTFRIVLNAYQLFCNSRASNQRQLVTADPAIITHLETAYMASGTDWQLLAKETQDFIASLA